MKALLLLASLFFPFFALAAPTDAEFRLCQESVVQGQEVQNDCYVALAYKYQDARICDRIEFSVKASLCRRNILLVQPNVWSVLSNNFVLVYASLFWLAVLLLIPPRHTYLQGAIFSLVPVGIYAFFTSSYVPNALRSFVPFVNYLLLPTNGLQIFAPNWFHEWPLLAQITFVQALFYSTVAGLLLQQTRRAVLWAIFFAGICILLSVRPELFFNFFVQVFDLITLLFSSS